MSAGSRRRQPAAWEPLIEITEAEILEDLCWPAPPPGRWRLPLTHQPHTGHIDALLESRSGRSGRPVDVTVSDRTRTRDRLDHN
jgi:hypothetical protein